ncbi:hypothetical protein COV11_04055 [Candidatus Woesearchaeota archaeon CG10_big_fil_rev_8_21_14_0_10_30_7]|nr:MAG: hypothetical protein COV11_04055 [Candidatus Woesearchaeota archaeon CG10_big_fil_rev_8_21_14_0_10_30_7]
MPKEVFIEKLLNEGLYESTGKINTDQGKIPLSILPVEFRKNTAFGIFQYEDRRLEIPIGIAYQQKGQNDHTKITLKKTGDLFVETRDNTLYLKLIASNITLANQCNLCSLEGLFVKKFPFAFYLKKEDPLIEFFFIANEQFNASRAAGDQEERMLKDVEEYYQELKLKPLINAKKVEIVEKHYNMNEEIKRLEDWVNNVDQNDM